MIIRFRGKDGSYRVNAQDTSSLTSVIADLEKQLPPHEGSVVISASPTTPGESSNEKWDFPVSQLGIKHGDMFFVKYESPLSELATAANGSGGSMGGSGSTNVNSAIAAGEKGGDDLDWELASKEGRIKRDQTNLCTHGAKGMCEYCQPLEPWDQGYQQSKGIKHVSIHAWHKKTQEEGGFLEQPNYEVNRHCFNQHAPWPIAFCSKCQPPAITLQQQRFRMVDHVEFVSPKIIEHFIEFWRQTSHQRIGFLIGKYQGYDDNVPLGIKAEVHAIWEPQQLDDIDSLLTQELPSEPVLKACNALGLAVVGIIFTDLLDLGDGSGKVVTKRHLNSYFLSSLEALLAARLQNHFPHSLPSVSRFSSRFVTCCVSGNEFGDIDVACYQVSTQAEAMVAADLVQASTNPSVVRIKPAAEERYVPDIFYKRINEYKLTVQEDAKPAFPVDYLLVSLSHGFKTNDLPDSFTIENRPQLRSQTPSQLLDALKLNHGLDTASLRDFHLLVYLFQLGVLQRDEEKMLTELIKLASGGEASEENITALALDLASGPGLSTIRMLAS